MFSAGTAAGGERVFLKAITRGKGNYKGNYRGEIIFFLIFSTGSFCLYDIGGGGSFSGHSVSSRSGRWAALDVAVGPGGGGVRRSSGFRTGDSRTSGVRTGISRVDGSRRGGSRKGIPFVDGLTCNVNSINYGFD